MKIKEVLEYYKGDKDAFAKDAGVTRTSINRYIVDGFIPVYRQCEIERATNGALKSNPKHINYGSKKDKKMDIIEKEEYMEEIEQVIEEILAEEEVITISKATIAKTDYILDLGLYMKILAYPEKLTDLDSLVKYFTKEDDTEEQAKKNREELNVILNRLSEAGLLETRTTFSVK